tara:strand:- start:608 stop:832 length:225 start_codon:yes stop_codon:yes gene_type:complete
MSIDTGKQRNYRETVFDDPLDEMPFSTSRSDVFLVAPLIGGYERVRQLMFSAPVTHRATETSIATSILSQMYTN